MNVFYLILQNETLACIDSFFVTAEDKRECHDYIRLQRHYQLHFFFFFFLLI